MNKFKLFHPLVMAIFYLAILIFFGYVHLVLNHPSLATVNISGYRIDLFLAIMVLVFLAFSVFFILYTYYLQKNSKENLTTFLLKPPEINEEDEGSKFIYSKATKRIYMYYTSIIPLLTLLLFFFSSNFLRV